MVGELPTYMSESLVSFELHQGPGRSEISVIPAWHRAWYTIFVELEGEEDCRVTTQRHRPSLLLKVTVVVQSLSHV